MPFINRKIGGVELPYLHVKKGDKTWYIPLVKNIHGSMKRSLRFMYKDEEYVPLRCKRKEEVGVITLVNGKIQQSLNFKDRLSIFFNKAKRLALYNGEGEYHKKLMDINYDDILLMWYPAENSGSIINLTTGETMRDYTGYRYLEFREE